MKKLLILLLAIFALQLHAQEIIGDWNGTLSIQGTELRIVFHITGQSDSYASTLDSPDQGAYGIEMDETTFENRKVKIIANALNAEFLAELNEDGDTLSGTFTQNGMSLDLIMTKEQGQPESALRP